MGFEWWSSEQRVRINLSETASVVISDDMYQFKIANRSTFMNIVFKNFYPIAKASITLYLDYKKKQLLDITKSNPALSSAQDAVINQLLLQEQKDYKDYIQFQAKNTAERPLVQQCFLLHTSEQILIELVCMLMLSIRWIKNFKQQ